MLHSVLVCDIGMACFKKRHSRIVNFAMYRKNIYDVDVKMQTFWLVRLIQRNVLRSFYVGLKSVQRR
jgi:hypothetical protein